MGPQYDPKRIFNDFYCPDRWLWVSKSACTSLEPSCCRLGAVQVMALGAKFGPPARWPMDLLHGTYLAWPMIG